MSYSGGSGGNGGYDRRGSGGSTGYGGGSSGTGGGGGYNDGSGSGYDQRSGSGGYDQRGGASGGYDQRGGSGGGYDQYGGSGGGGGYGASGGGGYDQRSGSGGYDQYRSSGGSGSTGYDQRSGSGGGYDQRSGGSGYDDYSRGGYDSRSSSGYAAGSGQTASGYGQSSRDYASGSGGYGEYQSGGSSSRGGYDERGYDNRGSGSGGYNSGYGASSTGSGGYGRGYEGTSSSSTSAGYGYKDERGGHSGGASGSGSGGGYGGGGSSSGGGYSRGYGETGSSSGGYGGSRDDRTGGGYGGGASSYGSRGYDERGSSSYGGGGSDRGSTSGGGDRYGGTSGGGDRYGGSSGGGDRYGGSTTGSYDRGGGGGRDDRRGSGGGGDDRGGRGGYGGGDRDDRGGRGGFGGRGGGRGGGGGGRGGGRGEMGQGVGEVKGTGYEQIGHALQDPRLVASWTGQVPPLVVPEDHVEMHRAFTVCRRPDAATNGRKIDVSINYFGVTLDTSRVQEIFKYHVAVERVHAADAKYGGGGDRAAEVKDEPMTGGDQQHEGTGGGEVKQESGEDVEMASAEAPPRGEGGPGGAGRDRGREDRKLSKQVVRMVINEALRAHEADFGGVKVAHDGMSAIYSPVRLPWTHRVFESINPNGPQAPHANQSQQPLPRGRGPPTFDVTIKEVESIPVTDLDAYYGNADHNPMRLIQALDVVARHLGAQRMIPVGRNLFSVKKTHPLQGGKELCWGYHQSIRIGQRKLLLNIDQAATVFYAPESLLTLAMACVRARSPQDMERLDERQLRMLARALRKIEVVPNHRTDRKRPIQTVSNTSADALMFDMRDGSSKSVAQYFREKYGAASLKYPFLPAVNVGSKQRANWLPLEVCDVAPGQRCANINELDTAEIIRKTCQKPRERQRNVMDQVHSAGFENDPYLEAFGLRVDQRMETVAARVLETPEVQYKNVSERPHQGAWNLRDKEFVDGAALENWGVVVEGGVGLPRSQVDNFVSQFCRTARICGMDVRDSSPVFLDGSDRRGASIEELMLECFREIERKGRGAPKLIMVVKRDASVGSYGEIKRVSDTVLGVPSQCIVAKNVPKANPQYCANVCLKVNMKLSGKNSILRDKFPLVSDVPTIIIGADVQHPRSGMGSRPSIASVVASLDKYSAKYVGRVASQKGNDIQKLPGMLRDLFLAYYQHTGRKPERVIYYRDGVSEGQFHDILQSEMHALRQAALMLEDSYLPPVTFIITNKRHHMRAFSDHNQNLDRSGNLVPGTVIDAGIVDSHRFDFFLYGHSGIQGTSCPAHYTVLHDENKLSSDEIQRLTYNLCYTYQRCTRSVSVVPPVYYAHLAAARAKFFLNEGSDGASTIGSYNSNSSSFEFAELHKNMLNCMFFV